MRKLVYICVVQIIFMSCSSLNKEATFKIINNSNSMVLDINISNGMNEIKLDTLKIKEEAILELIFKDVPVVDGGYKLTYKQNSKEIFKNFGYYSNGIPTNSIYRLTVENDTIHISEKMK